MPIVTFLPEKKTLEVKAGTNLMTAIIEAGLPIGSSCGALGICAKCFVEVVKGIENLSKPNPNEIKLLKRENFEPHIRIACQTKIKGDVSVTTSYW
jgi:ferredoxin